MIFMFCAVVCGCGYVMARSGTLQTDSLSVRSSSRERFDVVEILHPALGSSDRRYDGRCPHHTPQPVSEGANCAGAISGRRSRLRCGKGADCGVAGGGRRERMRDVHSASSASSTSSASPGPAYLRTVEPGRMDCPCSQGRGGGGGEGEVIEYGGGWRRYETLDGKYKTAMLFKW